METERVPCSICGEYFDRDINRKGGRLISCPAHSFGEVRPEDYETPNSTRSEAKEGGKNNVTGD